MSTSTIEVITPTITITRVTAKGIVYYTLSETNFGSLHHATFSGTELKGILSRLNQGVDERPPEQEGGIPPGMIEHGQIWKDWPEPGFVTVWERRPRLDKLRNIRLTHEQVCDLLNHFELALE